VRNEVSRRRRISMVQRKRKQANQIRHILCGNCLIQRFIGRKMEIRIKERGRPGRRRKQMLDGTKHMRRYWKLKDEALGRTFGGMNE
jgi:hypothetical protein